MGGACGAYGAAVLVALTGGGRGEAGPQLGVVALHLEPPTGLGVDQSEQPDGRKVSLARVADLGHDHVVSAGQRGELALPAAGVEQVGHDDDETTTSRGPSRPLEDVSEWDWALVNSWAAVDPPEQREYGVASGPRRHQHVASGPGKHGRDPVAVSGGEEAERCDRCQRQVALLTAGGAEVEAR